MNKKKTKDRDCDERISAENRLLDEILPNGINYIYDTPRSERAYNGIVGWDDDDVGLSIAC